MPNVIFKYRKLVPIYIKIFRLAFNYNYSVKRIITVIKELNKFEYLIQKFWLT